MTQQLAMEAFGHIVNADTWHNRLWTILVEEAGAYDTVADRYSFATHFPQCREYRFMGKLGFGGKVWMNANHDGDPYVNCYPEDMNPERREIIERTNKRLAELGA